MSQDAYPMPAADKIKSFRAMRLANLRQMLKELAPGNERAAAALARLEAIDCDEFWQLSHWEDDRALIRAAGTTGFRCRAGHTH